MNSIQQSFGKSMNTWISRAVFFGSISLLSACGGGSSNTPTTASLAHNYAASLHRNADVNRDGDESVNVNYQSSAATYTIGGFVTGMVPGAQVTMLNNGGDPVVVTAGSNGSGSFTFSRPVAEHGSYLVTVGMQPSVPLPNGQICSPETHNYASNDVTKNMFSIGFKCSDRLFAVLGAIRGVLSNSPIEFTNNGTDNQTVTGEHEFMFYQPIAYGASYQVAIAKLPFLQNCRLFNQAGKFMSENELVEVDCVPPAFETIWNFNQLNGAGPLAKLVQDSDGHFYGTTYLGGEYSKGTVFKITVDGEFITLHHFGADGVAPQLPDAEITVGRDGKLYGTTEAGGKSQSGTVYMLDPNGSEIKTVHSFAMPAKPGSGLIEASDGVFYGVAPEGDGFGKGSIFKITVDPVTKQGLYTSVHSFKGTDGSQPKSRLVRDGNFLYGTTRFGGEHDVGTIYSVNLTAGQHTAVQRLYSFKGTRDGNSSEGVDPISPMTKGADGHFYGVTNQGGMAGRGTIYQFNPSKKMVKTFVHFAHNGIAGAEPIAGLELGDDGSLYGVTTTGATTDDNKPTLFRFTPPVKDGGTPLFHTLHVFDPDTVANAGLLKAKDGNLYGALRSGGLNGAGLLYTFGRD